MTTITTVGLDLAKSVFQVHGTDEDGRPVVRKKLRRGQMFGFFSGLSAQVLSEELAVDMISLAFIVELIVLFSGFPGVAVFVRLK
jgi:transposase